MRLFPALAGMGLATALAAGCAVKSYPASQVQEALADICKKEYGIEGIQVKIEDDTIGVFLPLKRLFATDFKEAAATGKVKDMEALFEPSPEALEKVEDVLFSISRVILSTDRPIQFYSLQATDVEKTGMQLVLMGNVDDIKRVRVWDISRNEYRKRVIHELRLNRAVIFHQPVRKFFADIESLTVETIQSRYFSGTLPPEAIQTLFFNALMTGSETPSKTLWEILDIRSAQVQKNEVLVYTRVRPDFGGTPGPELEYLFMLTFSNEEASISRIIPFQYVDPNGEIKKIDFPKELQITDNLDQWEQEFPVEAIRLGPFLAEQLTRRVQSLLASDERIQNTFHEVRMNFSYHEDAEKPYFSMEVEALLREATAYRLEAVIFHEDMLYLLNLASREFVELMRSYQFGSYEYLSLQFGQAASSWILGREDLELFRRKKVDLQGLLTLPKI